MERRFLRMLQHTDGLLTRHREEALQEFIERMIVLPKFEEVGD